MPLVYLFRCRTGCIRARAQSWCMGGALVSLIPAHRNEESLEWLCPCDPRNHNILALRKWAAFSRRVQPTAPTPHRNHKKKK